MDVSVFGVTAHGLRFNDRFADLLAQFISPKVTITWIAPSILFNRTAE